MQIEAKKLEKKGLEFKEIKRIDIKDIIPNKLNPREEISKKEVADIRNSIREIGGILVPLVVYWDEGKQKYVLLDGERRWRAASELAKSDEKYRKIPANIIEGPLKNEENIRTMFNIHMQRKQWSTVAIAKAMDTLMKLDPEATDTELAKSMYVPVQKVREARLLLRMPPELTDKCLKDDLDEYYLILLARNLDVCKRLFPELFKKYQLDDIVRRFIDKVDAGLVFRTKDFNLIAQIARKCIAYDEDTLFVETFEKMVNEKSFTPADAVKYVDSKLSYKVDSLFVVKCKDFLSSLKNFSERLTKENIPTQLSANEFLVKINEEISQLFEKLKTK
jgi:ParB family chromosome partitioning protein